MSSSVIVIPSSDSHRLATVFAALEDAGMKFDMHVDAGKFVITIR
jgi:hypothetical protein